VIRLESRVQPANATALNKARWQRERIGTSSGATDSVRRAFCGTLPRGVTAAHSIYREADRNPFAAALGIVD
jgi:hypothetical protein